MLNMLIYRRGGCDRLLFLLIFILIVYVINSFELVYAQEAIIPQESKDKLEDNLLTTNFYKDLNDMILYHFDSKESLLKNKKYFFLFGVCVGVFSLGYLGGK